MGGLGHILEDEGLATVQISLIREHTEIIRPPRALWVPFILGRPLGLPDQPAFQRRVLRAALDLFAAPAGPVLVDYPEEAEGETSQSGWVCPVSFPAGEADLSLAETLRREMQPLRSWYDIGLEKRGRTTFGVAGLDIDGVADLLVTRAEGGLPDGPSPGRAPGRPLGETVRLAAEDLRAFYFEAVTAQPGSSASAKELKAWFWTATVAGEVLTAARQQGLASDDESLKGMSGSLVPAEYR